MDKISLNDPETKSADIVAENLERLKDLIPEAFTEGQVDFEVLRQILGDQVDDRDEKYGLNWHGKRRARQLALTPSTGTLRPCPEESVDWDTTKNLMIEGDNLEVLKLFQKSYAGKVKMIYIDPPYNTGKDFVYPDNFQDNIRNYLELTGQVDGGGRKISSNTEASGRFHTDWLNMMYPRLKLARNLLRDDGMMFISVDDGEVANLKQLMSEVFGAENFLACVAWEKRYTRSNNARLFYSLKDNVLVFRKSESVSFLREPRTEKSDSNYSNPDNDPRGNWTTSSYVNPATKEQRPNLVYKIENPVTGELTEHPTHAWKYEYSEHLRHIQEGRLHWARGGDTKYPRLKVYLSEREGIVPIDLWDYKSTGTTDEGGNELKGLFGEAVFDNPKPTRLIRRMLGLTTSSKGPELILDFFAGSGTTAQAVMGANADDGGNRRYILVQLPETLDPDDRNQMAAVTFCDKLGKRRNIAELTKERLRRAAKENKEENPLFRGDLGFRVFKLDTSNIRAWDPIANDLEKTLLDSQEHLKLGRTEQDILYELLLKLGLDLAVPMEDKIIAGKSVHSIGAGTLMVCLAQEIAGADVESLAQGIVKWHGELAPEGDSQVVFRDSAFADDVAKTNLTAILQQHGLENVRSL